MAQTALNGTCDDATVAAALAFTESEPTRGIYIYTDTGVAPASNGVAASTLHDYQRVRIKNHPSPIFNNTDCADPSHVAARASVGDIFYVSKIASRANKQQMLLQIVGGTYVNDYLRYEDLEYIFG